MSSSREIVLPDLYDWSPIRRGAARGYNACYFCLGVSSVGMTEAEYTRVTHDLTLGAPRSCSRRANPNMVFCYVTGSGTDSTGKGRSMWARVKGKTENGLLRLPFKLARTCSVPATSIRRAAEERAQVLPRADVAVSDRAHAAAGRRRHAARARAGHGPCRQGGVRAGDPGQPRHQGAGPPGNINRRKTAQKPGYARQEHNRAFRCGWRHAALARF